ncbi:hypothetical protein NP493_2395g00009 [Ridgeia piscesae]|uniref:G-protein coupled receptors family 1 profile domain-containing protein n=1 Tax=Ridgeia piscesae TaxID=27915 RepID=A0AAD9JHL4_RIDPI|nr:hypothetical protein NP493_2395g00009 [Ridgeia piscesae]
MATVNDTLNSTANLIGMEQPVHAFLISRPYSEVLWRYVWPPLCMMGLVGNTLVLLVLRRDGLVRTSANVYLSALAVGDSLVLMVATVAAYPMYGWDASVWLIVAFTVERCVVVRFPLLKLRLCTPRNAGLCCLSLLVLAFLKNIDLFFVYNFNRQLRCFLKPRYYWYYHTGRLWISTVFASGIPTCVVVACNWAIIGTLRRKFGQTAAGNSVKRTTFMCLGVSIAYIVCVVPQDVYLALYPSARNDQPGLANSLILLRYVNHANNFLLYSLTGAHFRCELVAVCRSWVQGLVVTTAVIRQIPSVLETSSVEVLTTIWKCNRETMYETLLCR